MSVALLYLEKVDFCWKVHSSIKSFGYYDIHDLRSTQNKLLNETVLHLHYKYDTKQSRFLPPAYAGR